MHMDRECTRHRDMTLRVPPISFCPLYAHKEIPAICLYLCVPVQDNAVHTGILGAHVQIPYACSVS